MIDQKVCAVCSGPYAEVGIEIHDQTDCIAFLKKRIKQARADTLREMDKQYNAMCEKKVDEAYKFFEARLNECESIKNINADSIRRGRMLNDKLRTVADAASYCLNHGYIDKTAVIFSGLAEALAALEES